MRAIKTRAIIKLIKRINRETARHTMEIFRALTDYLDETVGHESGLEIMREVAKSDDK